MSATLEGGAVDYIDQILGAGGLDYALFDFRKTDRLWQEAVGPSRASDNGELIGLGIGAERQGDKALAAVMAAQTELRGNGITTLAGSAAAATYNTSTGVGSANRVDASNQSGVQVAVVAGALYEIDIEATSVNGILVLSGTNITGSIVDAAVAGANRQKFYVRPISTLLLLAAGSNGVTCPFIVHSLRRVPAHYVVQTGSGGFKPQLQAAGAKFDGSDDNLLTDWLMQAGGCCMLLQVGVPLTLSTTLAIAGTRDTASSGLFWVGIGASGTVNMALGSNAATLAAIDTRGTDVIIGLSCDGTTVKGFVNNAETYSGVQSGAPSIVVPVRLGALNNNGVAASFWPGSIRRAALGKKAITLAEFQQIRSQWLAAA